MTKKMTMKTFKISFQNPPIFYDTLHLFLHTLILFCTVLVVYVSSFLFKKFGQFIGTNFSFPFDTSTSFFPSITARKHFIKQSQNYFIKDDKLWRQHPSNPQLVILNINRCNKILQLAHDKLGHEEYMEQPR